MTPEELDNPDVLGDHNAEIQWVLNDLAALQATLTKLQLANILVTRKVGIAAAKLVEDLTEIAEALHVLEHGEPLPAFYPNGTEVVAPLTPRQVLALDTVGRPPAITDESAASYSKTCPTCGAEPGYYCSTAGGWYSDVHRARYSALTDTPPRQTPVSEALEPEWTFVYSTDQGTSPVPIDEKPPEDSDPEPT